MNKKLIAFALLFMGAVSAQSYVAKFDGENDYLYTTDTTGTAIKGEFSLSLWMFSKSTNNQSLFDNGNLELEYNGYYGQFTFNNAYYTSNTYYYPNEWHHVVISAGSDSLKIYINGKENRSISHPSYLHEYSSSTYLGVEPSTFYYDFEGYMDEVAIWNTTLDTTAIQSLYNNGVPTSASGVNASNLRSYWKMDDGPSGTQTTNSVTASADLLVSGATWSIFTHSPTAKLIADINTASWNGSYPSNFMEYNNKVYFRATDGTYGNELWSYDPGTGTTERVTDIKTADANGYGGDGLPYQYGSFAVYGGKMYFVGDDGTYGSELWSYDGSTATRLTDIYEGSNSSEPKYLTVFDNKLFFVATNSTYGFEWYAFDGSTVTRKTDLYSGASNGIDPWTYGGIQAIVYNDKLYFGGYDGSSTGRELYSYDETNGVQLVADIYTGSYMSGSPQYFALADNKLFFQAQDANGTELFYYDGTSVTGVDIYTGSDQYGYANNGYPQLWGNSVIGDTLYFRAQTADYGTELWSYDATNGARLVKDFMSGESSGSPQYITAFEDKIYFTVSEGYSTGDGGNELWYYDGVDAGRVVDLYAGASGSYPSNLYATDSQLFFQASAGETSGEPYVLTSADPKPTIASATSTTTDGSYKIGDEINITLNFSEAVTLSSSGSVAITLETGTTDQTVTISSISSATSASATYTVQAGDVSSDLTVSSVSVSGSLTDATGQSMTNFTVGSNLASSSNIVVDGVLPTISSISSTSTDAVYALNDTVKIILNFTEKVSLSSGGTLTVTLETGTTDRTVDFTAIASSSSVTGDYIVQSGDASSDLSIDSITVSSGASLTDAAGNIMTDFTIPSGSNLSDSKNIVVNSAGLSTPVNFTADSRYGTVYLSWDAVSGATKYTIYRSTDNTTFTALSTEPTTNSYEDTPTKGSLYYYKITATSGTNISEYSAVSSGYPSSIWWVDAHNGDDNNNSGKYSSAAFKSIEQALKTNATHMAAGDTINVKPSVTSANPTGYYDFGNISSGIDVSHSTEFVMIGTAGADSTIFNAEGKNKHFRFSGYQTASKIKGITFKNGKTKTWDNGSSVYISGGSITFESCVFDSNGAAPGTNSGENGGTLGGAIYISQDATPSFYDCVFLDNYNVVTDRGTEGGAVYIGYPNDQSQMEAKIVFERCQFKGNYVKSKNNAQGGAIYSSRDLDITNCLFVNNGVIAGEGADAGNWESARGGAIYFNASYWSGSQSYGGTMVVKNSTFVNNYTDVKTNNGNARAADVYYGDSGTSGRTRKSYLFNSIITGSRTTINEVNQTNWNDRAVYTNNSDENRLYADYNTINGSTGQSWADDHVYDIYPVFADTAAGDYSLSSLSPVIGKGTSSYEGKSAPTTDIKKNTRPNPSGSVPDMGAYEHTASTSTAPLPVVGLTGVSSTNGAKLSWTANKASLGSSSNDTDLKYLIYQGSSQVGTTTETSFTVSGLVNGKKYSFTVAAQDTSLGITGAFSKTVSVMPRYRGPRWYVAASGGNALADTTTNYDIGGLGNPLNHMEAAIEAAVAGDTIVMLKGTHTGSSNRGINWRGSKNLVIMGDPDYSADQTTVDAGAKDRHFTFDSNEDSTYQIVGLTLYNGFKSGENGGSVVVGGTSPVFKNVIFKDNTNTNDTWDGGGAVYGYNASPAFYGCTFDGNSVDRTSGTGSQSQGGAVFLRYSNNNEVAKFYRCTFKNNRSKGKGTAYGGALWAQEIQIDLLNCLFHDNIAESTENEGHGGAIYITSPSYYSASSGDWVGGTLNIINCTIAINSTLDAGSGWNSSGGGISLQNWNRNEKLVAFNNIIWGNTSSQNELRSQISVDNPDQWQMAVDYNDIQGFSSNSHFYSKTGDHMFNRDPVFNDELNKDFSLSPGSKLIGEGTVSLENTNAPTEDILRNKRPLPNNSTPDLGAYENKLAKSPYPNEVTGLIARGAHEKVALGWNKNPETDIARYNIYMSTTKGFTPNSVDSIGTTTDTVYTVEGLVNKTEYFFRVSAVNTSGYEGDYSVEASAVAKYNGPMWYVAVEGTVDGDGQESTPFADLATAMGAAGKGHTIILKPGTHKGTGNRDILVEKPRKLTIRSEGDAEETVIDAEGTRHFHFRGPVDSTLVFKGIKFANGSAPDMGGWRLGGSMWFEGGSFWNDETQQNVEGYPEPRFYHCIWENNQAGNGDELGAGGVMALRDASPRFYDCVFRENRTSTRGGVVYTQTFDSYHASNPLFKNCTFEDNESYCRFESATGGAVSIEDGGMPKFIDCRFTGNRAFGENQPASGGAVFVGSNWYENTQNDVVFNRCIFDGNTAEGSNNNGAQGGAITAHAPYTIVNSLFVKNKIIGGWGGGGALYSDVQDRAGTNGPSYVINNTIVGNEVLDQNNNFSHSGGGLYMENGWRQTGAWFNNIVYYNKAGSNQALSWADGSSIALGYLCADEGEGQQWWDGGTMTMEKPKFKNLGGGDFKLTLNSPLIDMGSDEFGGMDAPRVDIRNYYRLEQTDIGAYEFGASKYILEIYDDIAENQDTTYLSKGQEFTVTIETKDNQNQVVTAEEEVKWFISPTDKYIEIVKYDSMTSEGSASIKIKASETVGFKFRVGVDIADAIRVTDLYVIEQMSDFSPPSITSIQISPSSWSQKDVFEVTWTNPDEGAYKDAHNGVEFLGAFVKIADEYPQYIQRTAGAPVFDVDRADIQVPELGFWNVKVWLVDEFGNENISDAVSVTAKFDDQEPYDFNISDPYPDQWVPDTPRFRWENNWDYPSGISHYEIFVDDQVFFTLKEENANHEDSGGDMFTFWDSDKLLMEGWHTWWVVMVDSAGNTRESNGRHNFGVDVNPPIIEHFNPLSEVNAGETTPTLDINIWDNGSGVQDTWLYYRSSGEEGSWGQKNLNSGSVSIPGSAITDRGLEYYIEAVDNLGYNSKWPDSEPFHSVRVNKGLVSSSERWSNGIPGGPDVENYQFFSIPFDVGNAKQSFQNTFGEYDKFNWRLYGYQGEWVEYPALSSITTGNAYFLIFDPGKYEDMSQSVDFGDGKTNPTDQEYPINISPGQWTFFGNPYNYNISLNRVYTEDGTNVRDAGSIYTWNDGSGTWRSEGSGISPWQGYIFKANTGGRLFIDGRGEYAQQGKLVNDLPLEENEWLVTVTASTGTLRDEDNVMGVRTLASNGYDRLDEFEPPVVPGNISLRINNKTWEDTPDYYAHDIRTESEEGHYWDMDVLSPVNGERTYLSFDGLGYVPEAFDMFLINLTTKTAVNLEWEDGVSFANAGSEDYLKQSFRLLIGTKDYVKEHNAGVSLYPEAYRLSQNYPNPFNPQTSIIISLEDDAFIDLMVYNVLGEEVTRIARNEHRPSGYYTFIWNGTNARGETVATGMYFYHALVRNKTGKILLNQTKKMILLK